MSMDGLRGTGAVLSIDMLIGTTIFLLAFSTATYLIVTSSTGSGDEQVELQSTALRLSDVLVRDGGWYGGGGANQTASLGPGGEGLVFENTGNRSAGNVNWERKWNSSTGEVVRIGFAASVEDFGPEPGDASVRNKTYPKVLSIYKVDGEYNATYGTEGLTLRHPPGAVGEGHGGIQGWLDDRNETWWWDFGSSASQNVSSSGDDVSAGEYGNATRAMGLGFKGYDVYLQLRPLNSTLYGDAAADEAVRDNVP